jgi:hypothetical protein
MANLPILDVDSPPGTIKKSGTHPTESTRTFVPSWLAVSQLPAAQTLPLGCGDEFSVVPAAVLVSR